MSTHGVATPRGGRRHDAPRPTRSAFRHFQRIATRWMDNDAYAHVNNVVYYAWFDTVVNEHLIRAAGLEIERATAIGLVVETQCQYFVPLTFPDAVEAGLAVTRLGRSSVTYALGIFREGDAAAAAAGRFVHVWVDRVTRRPVDVPPAVRAAVAPLVVSASEVPP
ncbi:MAG TPA: thioesterase family protein [Casimicrobiaceae bacterium]|jgi:acyl-CoA thioester hydrolase|nr:thioesterase family protein [Casimicrobiaceae bacterium]